MAEVDVQSPVDFWNPAGFMAADDADNFRKRRITELQHGRISTEATIGYMLPAGDRFDGAPPLPEGLLISGMPHGLVVLSKVPPAVIAQLVAFARFVELSFFHIGSQPRAR